GNVAIAVRHRRQAASGVIGEGVADGARERMQGAQMSAGRAKDVHLATVLGGDDDVATREPWQRWRDSANAAVALVHNIQAAIGPHGYPERQAQAGLGRWAPITAKAESSSIPGHRGDDA